MLILVLLAEQDPVEFIANTRMIEVALKIGKSAITSEPLGGFGPNFILS